MCTSVYAAWNLSLIVILTSPIMSSAASGYEYEEQHVHRVYDQIAHHFSSTRYKVRVERKEKPDCAHKLLLISNHRSSRGPLWTVFFVS